MRERGGTDQRRIFYQGGGANTVALQPRRDNYEKTGVIYYVHRSAVYIANAAKRLIVKKYTPYMVSGQEDKIPISSEEQVDKWGGSPSRILLVMHFWSCTSGHARHIQSASTTFGHDLILLCTIWR